MSYKDRTNQAIREPHSKTSETAREPQTGTGKYPTISAADVRHNLIFVVLLDAVFTMGVVDLNLVMSPMWVFFKASNTLVGLVGGTVSIMLIGTVLSPFITRRFRFKKWYLFVSHLPYIGAWGVIGLVLALSMRLGVSNEWLLTFVVAMLIAGNFFGGFVALPHQEYIAACIPMSHRGRCGGYAQTIGGLASLGSAALAGVILKIVPKPMSFGYTFLLIWGFCQFAYVFSLFGRERPTPVEKSPKPWSRKMIKAAWDDKKYMRLMVIQVLHTMLFSATFITFVPIYGFRELKMPTVAAAGLAMCMQVVKMITATPIGQSTDRLRPKRVLPFWALFASVVLAPLLVWHNAIAVFISMGLSQLYFMGSCSALAALTYGIPAPENRAGHFTVQLMLQWGATAAGPVLVGIVCDILPYRTVFGLLACASVGFYFLSRYLVAPFSENPEDYA
ncbi:MAG: MFS transporter [Armatimonadetes bacterium]|nr:MFS transporter [Armatimonadota bacterium]